MCSMNKAEPNGYLFSRKDRAQGRFRYRIRNVVLACRSTVDRTANGFSYDDPEWANMGQGAPETGDLPEGPPRIRNIDLSQWGDGVNEYASQCRLPCCVYTILF